MKALMAGVEARHIYRPDTELDLRPRTGLPGVARAGRARQRHVYTCPNARLSGHTPHASDSGSHPQRIQVRQRGLSGCLISGSDIKHQQAGFSKALLVDSFVHVSTHDAVGSRSSPSPATPPLRVTEATDPGRLLGPAVEWPTRSTAGKTSRRAAATTCVTLKLTDDTRIGGGEDRTGNRPPAPVTGHCASGPPQGAVRPRESSTPAPPVCPIGWPGSLREGQPYVEENIERSEGERRQNGGGQPQRAVASPPRQEPADQQ